MPPPEPHALADFIDSVTGDVVRLRERDRRTGDLSVDRIPPHRTRSPLRMNGPGRAVLIFALAVGLAIPMEAVAKHSPPDESTTTTTVASTTTTTTTEPTTTTTTGETSTTATPDDSEPDDSLDDSVDGEEEVEEEPVLLPLPSILFPIVGQASYRDTYDAPRDGGARLHKGTDISAEQGSPIVAVAGGVVERMGVGEKAGLHVVIRHRNGWRSAYAHLNNDSPGTDNGLTMGFGPGIEVGAQVEAGTVVGYVGDSGNSEENSPHLHFELHQPDGYRANPYPALRKARRLEEGSTLATVDYEEVQAWNTEMVGHVDPGTGFNAQISAVGDHVYLGTWGNEERCPGTGVRVFDVSDPTQPVNVAVFADHTTFPGTAAASVWVGSVDNEFFQGRLGVVGLARCGSGPIVIDEDHAGFAVYDVSDPTNPVLLSVERTGVINQGIVSLDVSTSSGQVLVGAVVADPAVGVVARGEVLDDGAGGLATGDTLRIFDITDPSLVRPTASWRPPLNP
ncbi:MAG: M23 family metallopeptidase, partial [Acidimicrobiia bacterium]